MKTEGRPQAIYLEDYRPANFLLDQVDLEFDLFEAYALVKNRMTLRKNPEANGARRLELNGTELQLLSVRLNGTELSEEGYQVSEKGMVLEDLPEQFELEIETRIEPQNNGSLEGLYRSRGIFTTQNESEGFRRITYFLDRPDIMGVYTTTIMADRELYPVLLSNGNLIESKELPDGRHLAKWHDPHKKPCYLFALVAGDLAMIQDEFTTMSGQKVDCRVYCEAGNEDRCWHAMKSLKQSMKWDEEVFGREYDLDIYMIVAVDDFNAGAMENKGLNIFNSSYVLANPKTATDRDYKLIQAVVGHEYFHNWSGNRVTLRDWFQLSLKEGLTVFREQEFSSDHASRAVQRIDDSNKIRTSQFKEDAGPMAHPVRPGSYIQISNFYTSTVYEKGSEVIRMIHTLLGPKLFRKGTDLYFDRHDGSAVTTEDFVQVMEEVSGLDLQQFRLWYTEAGTPKLEIKTRYDQRSRNWEMEVVQDREHPFYIPIKIGLLDSDGRDMPLELEGEKNPRIEETKVLHFKEKRQVFRFRNVSEKPIPSYLRGFSAPVKIDTDQTQEDLIFLMAHDSDAFSRWDAAHQLGVRIQLEQVQNLQSGGALEAPATWLEAIGKALEDTDADPALIARVLDQPTEGAISQQVAEVDIESIHQSRSFLLQSIADRHGDLLLKRYHDLKIHEAYEPSPHQTARRTLRNRCLAYLCLRKESRFFELAYQQFKTADNMTDQIGAMSALLDQETPWREKCFLEYYQEWKADPVVMNRWFALQASSELGSTFNTIKKLRKDPVFDVNNPNKVYSLFRTFATGNLFAFHDASGEPYEYLADLVLEIDRKNPSLSSRIVGAFNDWKRYEPVRRGLMKKQLERILSNKDISSNVYEIVERNLS